MPTSDEVKEQIRLAADKIARRLQDVPGDAELISAAAEFFSADVVADALDVFEGDDD